MKSEVEKINKSDLTFPCKPSRPVVQEALLSLFHLILQGFIELEAKGSLRELDFFSYCKLLYYTSRMNDVNE